MTISALVIIVALFALIVIIFVLSGLKIVSQSETMVIERLGKYHKTFSAGMHIIFPIIDKPKSIDVRRRSESMYRSAQSIARQGKASQYVDGQRSIVNNMFFSKTTHTRIDMREQVYDFDKQNVITRDNVVTEINALLYFQIVDPRRAVYEISDLPLAIEKLTQTTLRNVVGEMELDQTLTSRDIINSKLREVLDDATNKWGVKVNRVELQDITPPVTVKEAMEKQMQAERTRRANILEAEGAKKSAILKSEGEKEAKINEATAEKQAEILKAQGISEATILQAKAESEALRQITEAIAGSGSNPANYFLATKYIDGLKEMVSGKDNKTIYMPYEATSVLSSIGGIKELFSTK